MIPPTAKCTGNGSLGGWTVRRTALNAIIHWYIRTVAKIVFFLPALVLTFVLNKYTAWHQYRNNKKRKVRPTVTHSNKFKGATDLTKWCLTGENGRQVWKFDPSGRHRISKQTFWERYFLGLEAPPSPKAELDNDPVGGLKKGLKFYTQLQTDSGHWANDYGGPLFLQPGLVFTSWITGHELDVHQKAESTRYLENMQNDDGGWGLHVEGHSCMFGTVLNYVALRIMGAGPDRPVCVAARNWIRQRGGAQSIASWGKLWLCTLNLYDYKGLHPILPEMWLLPHWVPFHPGRMWCHSRIVYLPMAYLYGRKAKFPAVDLTLQLRKEIYLQDYNTINWGQQAYNCHELDVYTSPSLVTYAVNFVMRLYERFHLKVLRRKALSEIMRHIKYEDVQTNYICIGPVNKVLNMLSVSFHEGNTSHVQKHAERLADYLWLAADGMKMQGYNGSQLWDTAFSLQAIIESGLEHEMEEVKHSLIKGHKYIECTQVLENAPEGWLYYRHLSKGAWPFSTRSHGWPISDCTAEGLRCALLLRDMPTVIKHPIEAERLADGVTVLLTLQNPDGGWASYERMRAGRWMELLNPSECFWNIMVDYPYVECTSACIQSMSQYLLCFPNETRASQIKRSIAKGRDFIKSIQRPDGSWLGSWGVCITYAMWFGVAGLTFAGEPTDSPVIQKALSYLLAKQNKDGGWGEDFNSCVAQEWVQNPNGSQVVNTAWALLALMAGKTTECVAVERGIRLLLNRQLSNGDWKQESISGVFNANCAISYSGYKNIFPIWALGAYAAYIKKKH